MNRGREYAIVAVVTLFLVGSMMAARTRDPYRAGRSLGNCMILFGGVAYAVGRWIDRRAG